MAMKHMQNAGHRPIALLGGGTTMIGDPSGKSDMRSMLTRETIEHNAERFHEQLSHFIDFSDGKAIVANNADWLLDLNYVQLLREVGVHFSVNRMLTAECYKQRMERGLTFFEFNYMIMQSYDFWKLNQLYNCQAGDGRKRPVVQHHRWRGADQKKRAETGLRSDLQTADYQRGHQDGQNHEGCCSGWIRNKTSPYEFYQYWRNIEDVKVEECLGTPDLPSDGRRTQARRS